MWSHRVARAAVSKQLCYSNVAFQADVTWDFSPQSVPPKTETWPDSSPLTGRSLHSVGFKRKVDGLVILRRALQSSTPFHQCLVLKVPSCILKEKFSTLRQLTPASHHKRATRTHTLVKSKILIVVVKRRQKGRDPGVIPLRSHPRSTLFSAQPSLTSTAKWPNYQPPALYPFKCPAPQSLTIICNCDFRLSSGEANINWAQNEISHLLYLDHDVLVFMPRDALVVWNDRNQHLQPETLVLHIVDILVAALIEEKWLSMDI